jgi:hypothetical protein
MYAFFVLFHDDVSGLDFVAQIGFLMNNELERMWKEMLIAKFEVLSRNFVEKTAKDLRMGVVSGI